MGHRFTYQGTEYLIMPNADAPKWLAALYAEILRLAEERQADHVAMLEDRDRFGKEVAQLRAERDTFRRQFVEEAQARNRLAWELLECQGHGAKAAQTKVVPITGAALTEHVNCLEAQVAEQARTIDRLREEVELARAAGRQVAAALAAVPDENKVERQRLELRLDDKLRKADQFIQEQKSTIDSLWTRLKRRKAKIRRLKESRDDWKRSAIRASEEVRELQPWTGSELDAARRAGVERGAREGRMAEREAVLVYFARLVRDGVVQGESDIQLLVALKAGIRNGEHLTAPAASQLRQPASPAQEFVPE